MPSIARGVHFSDRPSFLRGVAIRTILSPEPFPSLEKASTFPSWSVPSLQTLQSVSLRADRPRDGSEAVLRSRMDRQGSI